VTHSCKDPELLRETNLLGKVTEMNRLTSLTSLRVVKPMIDPEEVN
jgi:hypothetical protein